ncbi:MAG: hypothetical protein FJX65_10865 [Alphaproteobacteria bacterium]|nr:hypothetical protein [Alphaproteobacteria bacterium]
MFDRGNLGPIILCTVAVRRCEEAVAVYQKTFGLSPAGGGVVSPALASAWGAPAMAGRRYAVAKPESGEPGWLRFVETDIPDAYRPLASTGWAAIEILVAHTPSVRQRVASAPFKVIGEPHGLRSYPEIIAMQAIGPNGEVLYLTNVPAKGGRHDLPNVRSFVDRVFIAVLGVPDYDATLAAYKQRFGLKQVSDHARGTNFIGETYGIAAPEWPLRMGTLQLSGQSVIQVDEYTKGAGPRPTAPGSIPAGYSITSMIVPSLDPHRRDLVGPVVNPGEPPYNGRAMGVWRAPGGELIELVEAGN